MEEQEEEAAASGAAAAAEHEKHVRLAEAAAAEAQHVTVDSTQQAKKLKLQKHNKFE